MALFSSKIIRDALLAYDRAPTSSEVEAARDWASRVADPGLDLQNESQLEQEFNRLIVQQVLGYRAPSAGMPGTMRVKQPVPGGTIVDLALGEFEGDRASIIAPFELKGPKVRLDRIMPGRAKTPVQQAWDYAIDTPGARWVLLSDMREIRLYAFGHGRQDYELLDLKRLGDADELRRLQLLLRAEQLLGGATVDLLQRSAEADRDITDALYRDYRRLRDDLLTFAEERHPQIAVLERIEIVQRLLDRLLFIAFAEDSFLLPEDSLRRAIEFHNPYDPKPKWEQLKRLFKWVDKGASAQNIPPYNGGLFRANPVLDALDLPDELVQRFAFLSGYDFRSEVSVTILGHIFEQSITDVEALHAAARGEIAPQAGKRKREGVVYTPDFVTRFIVEQTVGKTLAEAASALLPQFGRVREDGDIQWKGKQGEADYWRAYLDRLASLRIVDPACGSGAFLVAAFDYLQAEQRRVRTRLGELNPGLLVHLQENADVEIITNNLFGVDVNAESVELTKLALWLKTAKRNRPLESLDDNIKVGNSLVSDAHVHERPFEWRAAFPTIFHGRPNEGFDVVVGNPPYVRMEFLKSIKPYLEQRYEVASDRADLYAYFFELGVNVLKGGGRLGYISSSTFFRTGSGAPLRQFLAARTGIETVVDFGDLQLFEGVTTYPAVITLRKHPAPEQAALNYLTIREMPQDLSRAFDSEAKSMPRSRLGRGSWRFESDALDAIRAKMLAGRPTLSQAFGRPLYGIKTGCNAAFVVTRETRDALIAEDRRSDELLQPFLIGENCKRWHAESDDLWLIYTPKNAVDIDDYPAIRDHLAPHRERLEARATKQNWWELQQPQANYEKYFRSPKLIWPHFQNTPQFSSEQSPRFLNNKCFFWPGRQPELCAFLNSRPAWFLLTSLARAKRGGYIEAEAQYVGALPHLGTLADGLAHLAEAATTAAVDLDNLRAVMRHRLSDLSRAVGSVRQLEDPSRLTFSELQAVLKQRCKITIPVAERDEWEEWFAGRRAEAETLVKRIADTEAEIDARVYSAFELSPTEVAAVEDALVLASPALGLRTYEAISAVEGLELSDEGRERVAGPGTTTERRAKVSRAHAA